MVIVAAGPRFEVVADNTLEGGRGVFNATPAFDRARLLVRSNRALCAIARDSGDNSRPAAPIFPRVCRTSGQAR
jgi:hypothetical protein